MCPCPQSISVCIQFAWIAAILASYPSYLVDDRLQLNPDARHYYALARNMVDEHVFSRSSSAPFMLDPIRTPGYPAVIALFLIAGLNAVLSTIVLQVVLYVLATLILYYAVRSIFDEAIALIAAILMTLDATCHLLCYMLLTETIYMFALVLAFAACLYYLARRTVPRAALIGIVLSCAAYLRPSAVYLAIAVMPVFLFASGRMSRKAITHAAATMVIVLVLCAPWVCRNAHLFGITKMSIIDDINAAYATGASVYATRYGISWEEAQDRISREYSLPTYPEMMNFGVANASYRDWAPKLRRAGFAIIAAHPWAFMASSVRSIVQSMISHSVNYLAYILGTTFSPLSASLAGNSFFVNALFCYEIFFNVTIFAMFAIGLPLSYIYYRTGLVRNREAFFLALVFLAYLFAVTATLGSVTYFRFRAPNMPFVYIFSALPLSWCVRRFMKR